MADHERGAIRREIRVNARPEISFTLLTDAAWMVRWHGTVAHLDPRPGGGDHVRFDDRDAGRGRHAEVVPHRRVVFTWG